MSKNPQPLYASTPIRVYVTKALHTSLLLSYQIQFLILCPILPFAFSLDWKKLINISGSVCTKEQKFKLIYVTFNWLNSCLKRKGLVPEIKPFLRMTFSETCSCSCELCLFEDHLERNMNEIQNYKCTKEQSNNCFQLCHLKVRPGVKEQHSR